MKIEVICQQCNKKWIEWASNKRKFCSRKCFTNYWVANVSVANKVRGIGMKKYTCPECNVVFVNQRSNYRKYCSRQCSNKHTLITRDKVLGDKNFLWKGGASLKQVRPTGWRMAVLNKDNYTCQMCYTTECYLEADHIKPWYAYPLLRDDVSNGQALCKKCHSFKTMKDLYEMRHSIMVEKINDTWYEYL